MTDSELLELAEKEPATVETTTKALKSAIDFQKGRGAMLAALKTQISANTNPALTNALNVQLPQLQQQLVDSLMESGALPASAILNTMGFNAADVNT